MFEWLLEKEDEEEAEEEEVGEEEEEEGEELVVDEETTYCTKEITECFSLFDKTRTGHIDPKYLEKALSSLGIFLTPLEVSDVTEELEVNGVIPFDKFRTYALEKMLAVDQVESLKAAFQSFDPDKEGILSTERFKKWMTSLGDPLTEKEAKELAKMGDPAGKGIMAYDDVVMLLLKK